MPKVVFRPTDPFVLEMLDLISEPPEIPGLSSDEATFQKLIELEEAAEQAGPRSM